MARVTARRAPPRGPGPQGHEDDRARRATRAPADTRRPRPQSRRLAGADDHVMTTVEATLPPGPRLPKILQTAGFIFGGPRFLAACRRRYGSAVTFSTVFDENFVMVFDPV